MRTRLCNGRNDSSSQQSASSFTGRPFPVQAKTKEAPSPVKDTAKIEKQAESIARLGVCFDKVRLFPEQRRPSRDSGGSPLPGLLRRKMELAFAADFSEVRVHQGPDAQALSALAFTQGREVHFAPGQYNPSSAEGQKIIGHELAHVVQQQSGKVARPQGGGVPINDDASLEAEADRQAQQAVGSSGFVGIRRENPLDTASAKGCPGLSCWDFSEPAGQPVLSESTANLPIQKCSSCGADSCASGEKCGITGHSLE